MSVWGFRPRTLVDTVSMSATAKLPLACIVSSAPARARGGMCVRPESMSLIERESVCVCVCLCVRERERKRKREKERERCIYIERAKRERERERERERQQAREIEIMSATAKLPFACIVRSTPAGATTLLENGGNRRSNRIEHSICTRILHRQQRPGCHLEKMLPSVWAGNSSLSARMRQRANFVLYEAFYLIVSKQIGFDERSVVLG